MTRDLKPCYRCKSDDIYVGETANSARYGWWEVRCRNCGFTLAGFERETEIVSSWNTIADSEKHEDRITWLLRFITNPTKHNYWSVGDPDCPEDIKAPNGELHTLRCKVCGDDTGNSDFCLSTIKEVFDV